MKEHHKKQPNTKTVQHLVVNLSPEQHQKRVSSEERKPRHIENHMLKYLQDHIA
jgi:hypothetical protein